MGGLGFAFPPHIEAVVSALSAVDDGECRRLAIVCPPGFGKSTILQFFEAYYLARHPGCRLICASHTQELADRNSRTVRGLVDDSDRWPFPVQLNEDSSAVQRWDLDNGSGYLAIGEGGSITGWRGSIVLDDIEHGDESSDAAKGEAVRWYRENAVSRLEPGGFVVSIMTRSREDDFHGIVTQGPGWQVIHVPALDESGESTWPQRWSTQELLARKAEMGTRRFVGVYQGDPLHVEGAVFKAEWFRRYTVVPEVDRVYLGLDAAAKEGVGHDYSGIVAVGFTKSSFPILEALHRRVELPDLRRFLIGQAERFNPTAIYVEDTSNAIGLIQELHRESTLPIVACKVKGNNVARVDAIAGLVESGRVLFPAKPELLDLERGATEPSQGSPRRSRGRAWPWCSRRSRAVAGVSSSARSGEAAKTRRVTRS